MTDRLSQLIQAVEEADSSKRLYKAVQDLANARLEGGIPILIEALSYNNPGAAVAARSVRRRAGPAVPGAAPGAQRPVPMAAALLCSCDKS